MAKLALTVIGMGVGFMIGGPMGAQIGAMIGGMVGNALFSPTIKGPRMTDLSVTASTYGNTICELYGTSRMSGNVIWSAGIKEHKHKSSGKGGPKQVNYTYTCSFAIAFAKGPVNGLTRIWADGKLIAGSKPTSGSTGDLSLAGIAAVLSETSKKKGKFHYRFYLGDEDQTPDSTIVADKGAGNAPAYRGLAYLVFKDMPLEDFGNRIPQITAELSRNPVVTVPYVNFSSDTTTYADPGSNWHTDGTPDWENNQFYKYDNGYFIDYDMRTMQELVRFPVQGATGVTFAPQLPHNSVPCFSVGGSYFFDGCGFGNSGTYGLWDARSGAFLTHVGINSNAVHEDPMGDHDQPFNPETAKVGASGTAMWFRVLSAIGQEDFVYHAGVIDSWFTIWTSTLRPAHYTEVPFGTSAHTWTPMRGRENPPSLTGLGNSDFLLMHSIYDATTHWDVHLKIINFKENTQMILPVGPPWDATNFPLTTETDLALPRPFPGEDFFMDNCAYDPSDNGIVIWGRTGVDNLNNGGTWRFAKYLIDEGAYKWAWKDTDLDPSLTIVGTGATYTPGEAVGAPPAPANQSNLDGGTVGWMRRNALYAPSAIYVADLNTGQIVLSNITTPLPTFAAESQWPMNAWDDQTQSILGAPARIFVNTQGEGVTLQSIVDDVLLKTGALDYGTDWDSSALASIMVHGYVISRDTAARDVLLQLASAYFFDGVESDYKIKMTLRGATPVATISDKHLSWAENRDISVKATRVQEVELPMRVTVSYVDTARNYQEGSQSAKRNTDPFPTMHSHTEQKFELPIAMTATDAKRIADKSLKMAWNSRVVYKMKWPWEFLKYDPTDVVTVTTAKGNSFEMRLSKLGLGVDYTIDAEGTADQAGAYASVVVGDPGSGVPVQTINLGGPLDLFLLNTPLLRDMDDTQGIASVFYAAAKAKSPGTFSGGYLFEATDAAGTEFEDKDRFSAEPVWGIVQNTLPAVTNYALDTTTTLRVRIMSLDASFNPITLSSCTLDDLLVGKNAAIVGNEVIQFMTATPLADGRTYDLTGLLRARRGTNYAVLGHIASERFVLLDPISFVKESNGPTDWATTHKFKAVSAGEYEEDIFPTSLAMQPNDLKPYTPEQVRCSDDGTNVTITFERRSRIGSELHDGDGNVPYREGQGALAHFVYKVYGGSTLAAKAWEGTASPTFNGTVPIYSGTSFVSPLTFNFAMAGITEFVVEIYEVGFADGFPKIVYFKRIHPNQWDMTELY